ncbi:MAG: entry exclusion lipoprotein TrbK [Methylobacter sp.]|nr:entry exclusion lipoprotein TrbK [Methylococcales bacterium]MDD5114192.1 entry exclusion lipoprotein TrbK [Methylobacter sp.]
MRVFKQQAILLAYALTIMTSVSACAEKVPEPKTDAEWEAFCNAPDFLETVKKIKNKEQREEIGSTCFRAPWRKFKPSTPKSW